jgi:hypothetical protein
MPHLLESIHHQAQMIQVQKREKPVSCKNGIVWVVVPSGSLRAIVSRAAGSLEVLHTCGSKWQLWYEKFSPIQGAHSNVHPHVARRGVLYAQNQPGRKHGAAPAVQHSEQGARDNM